MLLKRLFLAAAALATATTMAHAEPKLIAIASFGEHPALTETADGFKARMTELGYVEGTDVVYDFQHANFDRSLIPQVLQQVEAKKPALIFAITTGLNQAAVRGITDKSIPIVFGAVVDPVVAGIVPDWEHGSEWSAGAAMLPNFKESLSFLKEVIPGIKKVGTLFNPGEDNDATNIKLINEAAAEAGIEIVAVPVDNQNDLPQRVQSFAGQVDAIFLIQSNIVQTAVPVVAQAAQRIKLPLFNSVYAPDLKDQLAGFHAISYWKNGEHAADIADRILKGEKPADIATYIPQPEDFDKLISVKGLEAVGLTLPEALKDSPWIIK
ncbi:MULTISPECIES: ABC transporter substrate-binding protein [Devosia]|uniref:ABC transporter substrate binding protein n=1 Tax=Devosia equisanguinis TaxID=2490941 RepID=A0A3S4D5N2_9HYPH|nr:MULTISPECIES: ABC transporter substrate-binding protein [Devosia]VDS05039.1 ABC transporter substrate binding protein [Devosia equisanguinis]